MVNFNGAVPAAVPPAGSDSRAVLAAVPSLKFPFTSKFPVPASVLVPMLNPPAAEIVALVVPLVPKNNGML